MEKYALKNELEYQKRYLEKTVEELDLRAVKGDNSADIQVAVYRHWLNSVYDLIKICNERNRY